LQKHVTNYIVHLYAIKVAATIRCKALFTVCLYTSICQCHAAAMFLKKVYIMLLQEFDAYIQDAILNPKHSPQQRRQLLLDWEQVGLSNTRFKQLHHRHAAPLHTNHIGSLVLAACECSLASVHLLALPVFVCQSCSMLCNDEPSTSCLSKSAMSGSVSDLCYGLLTLKCAIMHACVLGIDV